MPRDIGIRCVGPIAEGLDHVSIVDVVARLHVAVRSLRPPGWVRVRGVIGDFDGLIVALTGQERSPGIMRW